MDAEYARAAAADRVFVERLRRALDEAAEGADRRLKQLDRLHRLAHERLRS